MQKKAAVKPRPPILNTRDNHLILLYDVCLDRQIALKQRKKYAGTICNITSHHP